MRAVWTVPVIAIILLLSIGLSHESFAGFFGLIGEIPVTPDRQSSLVGETQTYSVIFGLGGDFPRGPPTLTVSCDPTVEANFPPIILDFVPTDFTITSDTPGIFRCEAVVEGNNRGTGDPRARDFILTGDFVAVFNTPPIMCGLNTVLDTPTNKCLVAPVITDALATCEGDLGVCEGDLGVCEGDLGVCEGERDAFEFDLGVCEGDLGVCEEDLDTANQDFSDLLAILLSGKITICHDDVKTQTISVAAFGTHFLHGDTIGACQE